MARVQVVHVDGSIEEFSGINMEPLLTSINRRVTWQAFENNTTGVVTLINFNNIRSFSYVEEE